MESNKELFNSLILFQRDLKNPSKNTSAFKYKYSPIEVCWEAVRKNLADNGLAVSQFPLNKDGMIGVRTLLVHSSGQFLESEFFVESLKKDIQSIGALYSYIRRYAFCSCLGITPEAEDHDGIEAMPTKDDSDKVLTEIKKALKMIEDTLFVEKVSKFIEKNSDLKTLNQVLGKCLEQLNKETA
jgi:hypothetical protein